MLGLLSAFVSPALAGDTTKKQSPEKAPTPPEGYVLVWNDEFNGTSLDRDAWNIEVNDNGNGNDELQYYTDRTDNVNVGIEPESGENCLILTAKKEDYSGRSFTSGRITTDGNMVFTRGIIESRIKLPKTANGLWPAFWLLGANYSQEGWPRCGEIDILEMGNAQGIAEGTQDRYFNGACHWGYYNSNAQYPNYAKATTNSYSLQDGEFHTFTLEWDEQFISMYLDRETHPKAAPYYRIGVNDMSNDWGTGYYFQHDFFVIFNLAVGGLFTGIISPASITALNNGDAKMYVDWVRVYQKTDDTNAIVPNSYKPTDVKKTIADNTDNANGEKRIYDMLGRRVDSTNTNGIYIERSTNGVRKFVGNNN